MEEGKRRIREREERERNLVNMEKKLNSRGRRMIMEEKEKICILSKIYKDEVEVDKE